MPESGQVAVDDPALEAALGVRVESRIKQMRLPADPEVTGDDVLTLAMTAAVAAPVGHFVELLRANLLAMGAASLEQPRLARIARFFLAAFRARSFSPERLLSGMNRLGTGCVIHPTAVVEASRLGDFVEVGPHAVVRGCHIAKDVQIGPHAIAEFSVVGEGARMQRRATVAASVVYPRARLGGFLQLGVAGAEAVTKVDSVTTDMRVDGPVRVMTPVGLRAVDIGYQGVCLGHQSWVGSGVWIAPGRVVEAGARLARARDLFVT